MYRDKKLGKEGAAMGRAFAFVALLGKSRFLTGFAGFGMTNFSGRFGMKKQVPRHALASRLRAARNDKVF
jgi:hypothetical protein